MLSYFRRSIKIVGKKKIIIINNVKYIKYEKNSIELNFNVELTQPRNIYNNTI